MFRRIIITSIMSYFIINYCSSESLVAISPINSNKQRTLTEHEIITHSNKFVLYQLSLVARYMISQGRCPNNIYTSDRFIAKAEHFNTQHIKRINVQEVNEDCTVTAIFSNDNNMNNIAGKTITFTIKPMFDGIIWHCDSNIKPKYLPGYCKTYISGNEVKDTKQIQQRYVDRKVSTEKRQSKIEFVVKNALGSLFAEETKIIQYYYDHNGECPEYDFRRNGFDTYVADSYSHKIDGKCVITSTFRDPVIITPSGKEVYILHEIAGKKISLTMTATEEGRYFWACSSNINKEYLPESCLKHISLIE